MKKINLKTALIIIFCVVLVTGGIMALVYTMADKPDNNQNTEVELPQPEQTEEDKYKDSIVDRKEPVDYSELFNYNLGVSVKEKGKFEGLDVITLTDKSMLFVDEEIAEKCVLTEENGIIKIQYGLEYDIPTYTLELKKIYNEPYKNIKNTMVDDTDITDRYNEIYNEYMEIYQNTDSHSFLECGGVSSYAKMVDFISENGLQYDVGLYDSEQTKKILEKAFDTKIEDFMEINYTVRKKGLDIGGVANLKFQKIEEVEPSNNKDDINEQFVMSEAYYIIADGQNVYAAHITVNKKVSNDFDDYIQQIL